MYCRQHEAQAKRRITFSSEIFTVEKILKKRRLKGVQQYLVKWAGYPDSESTWEPAAAFVNQELVEEFEARLRWKKEKKGDGVEEEKEEKKWGHRGGSTKDQTFGRKRSRKWDPGRTIS